MLTKAKSIICLLLFISLNSYSQQQESFYDPGKKYRLAYELFVKEKYSAARDLFKEFIADPSTSKNDLINAEYYSALSGAELYHRDAENELVRFIEKYPESLKAKVAYFNAAKVLYKQKKYSPAIRYFEKTDISYLNNDEIAEYYFKLGYSYFRTKDLVNASKNFHEILNIESKYQTAATYYYAHVAYQNNNLNTALEYFKKLEDSDTFSPVVPYYIIQIYYEQKKYDDVISYSKSLEGKGQVKHYAEINRYVAESYYKKGDCKNALKMFEEFEKNYPRLSREDFYQLGYCNYQMGNCEKAVKYFERVVNVKDQLQQTAYFNLADCFLKLNDKQSARNAFQFASKADYDLYIKEESQFHFSKLSFELSYQPVAINALNDFIKEFPKSEHIDESNEILAQLYITTKNYKDALEALDKIRTKSKKANAAYQKVAYFRGIEYFNDRDYEMAIGLFTKAIVTDVDPLIRAQAMYWKAEAFYNQNKYEAAVKQYRIFFFNPPSVNTSIYHTANYNLGYSHFKLENYEEANTWFRKYLRNKNETDDIKYYDALLRIGDGFFVLKDYDNAINFYNQVIVAKSKGADYAIFQTGIISGITGNQKEKVTRMSTLESSYTNSPYKAAARYEKGEALLALEEYKPAEDIFKKILRDFPESGYAKQALLKVALVQYNLKQDEEALTTYKEVVKKYPSSTEAVAALTGIKNIYVSSGNPDGYFNYIKNVPALSISAGAQDSITYEAAEQLYMKGDHSTSTKSFSEYINKYPNGVFVLNATFYRAESNYRNKFFDNALTDYLYVIDKPRNIFTEKSLLKAATVYYNNKNCEEALPLYVKLEEIADFRDNVVEAQAGQMRCHYASNDYSSTIIYAKKLIEGDKVPIQIANESHLLYARSSIQLNDLQTASDEFTIVAKIPNSEAGAEAKYSLAFIQYKLNNFKESQKKCFEVIKQVPSYEYWIGKSFLLLGDNYLALKDNFQAKHTYQSIIDNYEKNPNDPEDIRVLAAEKLAAIEKGENEKIQKEINEKEIQYFGNEKEGDE